MKHSAAAWPLLPLLALACDERLVSSSGRLEVLVPGVYVDPITAMNNGAPVLEGTRLCPSLRTSSEPGAALDVSDCYTQSVVGDAAIEADGCLRVGGPGPVDWRFEPTRCALPGVMPRTEGLALQVVGAGTVHGALFQWPEVVAERELEGDFPPDWSVAPGSPLRLVLGGTYEVGAVLNDDNGVSVGWNAEEATWSMGHSSGRQPVVAPSGSPGRVLLTAIEESMGYLNVAVSGHAYTLSEVRGVAARDLDSLEVVPAYLGAAGGKVPIGARAVLRDGDGEPVFGAPVTWSMAHGRLVLGPGGGLPGLDYAWLGDGCRVNGEPREATVRAEYDDLHGVAALVWDGDGDPADPEECTDARAGCDCDAAGAPSRSPGATLALVGAILSRLRRARRRCPPA